MALNLKDDYLIPYPYDKLDINYEEKFDLKEKHDKMLKALVVFDKYCRDNDILYSLADGTLLGALRHGDFVPWDDDADVMMNKKEYLKLRNSLTEESPIKLFKIGFLDRFSTKELLEEGEYIDLFINEDMPKSKTVFMWKKFKTAFLRSSFIGLAENVRHRKYSPIKKCLRSIVVFFSMILSKIIIMKRDVFLLNERTVDIRKHKQSGFYTRYTSRMYETKRRFSKNSYEEGYLDVSFRGVKLMSIKNADVFLKEMYGDYQLLPEESKRIPEHPINMLTSSEKCIKRFN